MFGAVSRVMVLAAALVAAGQADTKTWGYKKSTDEEVGPADWKEAYPACGGSHQSPINIPVRDLSHNDWDCTVKSINFDGREYALAQFHIHSTSEHTLDYYHYDAEIHFVHKDADTGTILVTGVFLAAEPNAEPNPFINSLWEDLVSGDEEFDMEDGGTNYAELLNGLIAKNHLFNYNGSLTTPPCSEVVDWWVLNNPVPISYDQLRQLKSVYQDLPATSEASDNRPTQPLNDRQIKYY
ncbi:unnamed protein product [Phytophthora fragariaefolia]|uniref:Carbonic anhydrase n=1 Tax=Phytophthora fragariaefolia TaxID=1490495 RepID=A0A9W7D199_9STRA|nr:unnamed protein product [Phytophthora fragariaefolia]